MASQWPPKRNTAFTLYFTLYKNDGTIIANPGTITKKVSIDGAAVADITAAVTEEDTTYGQCSVVIAEGEMNGDAIWIYIKDDTAGCVPFTCTIYTAGSLHDEIKADTAAILLDTGTDGVVLAADAITAAKIADDAFSNEHFATGALTADAFAADALVAATFATDCITDDAIATGAIASTAFAAGAINAAAIADGAIDNATFAADVGSTAYATNIIAIAAKKAIDEYDPPTKTELDTAVANVSVDEIQASALADLFNTDSGTTYGAAVAGSVVSEIADNAGGSALTADGIADAVWDEAIADHTTGTTFGGKNQKVVPSETLNDYKATGFSTHAAADVWSVGTRVLTAGTNIALAKGTGLTGLNDIAAGAQMDLIDAPNATAVTAIQAGLATPTNITAGTITTVSGNVDGSTASVTGGVTLANGAHGGAATVLTFKQLAGANSDAGGSVVSLTATGTGNSHGLLINATNGKAMALGSTNNEGVSIDSAASNGFHISGAAGADIIGNITGTLATCTTNTDMLTAAAVNAEVDTALNTAIPATPTAGSVNAYLQQVKFVMKNKMEITEANGNTTVYKDDGVSAYCTVAAAFTTDSTTTTRKALQ